jgi:hypothetical protein
MERYIGMDVHAASCTLAVISQTGKRLKDFPVETNGQALVEAIRMIPGHKHLVFEEGLQSAWLYETLSPHVDELVVAGITESRGPKSDKRDAYGLAEKLRVGSLDKPVFKAPRQFTRLRELSRIHMTLVGDVVRGQSRIKSLYRSRGIPVSGVNVYGVHHREAWQKVFITARRGRRSSRRVHRCGRLASTLISTSCSSRRSRRRRIYFERRRGVGSLGSWRPHPASDRSAQPGWCRSW